MAEKWLSLVDLLQARAQDRPDDVLYCFTDGESQVEQLTYGELDRRALAIAAMLADVAAPGARALLLYSPGLDFMPAFFGCLYAGLVAVPLPPPDPFREHRALARLRSVAGDARPELCLSVSELQPAIAAEFAAAPELGSLKWLATDEVDAGQGEGWRPDRAGRNPAYLQYTSGSTSAPRGVMISHGNVLHNSAYIRQAVSYEPSSIGVTWVPNFHDDGLVHGIIQPLFSGFRSYLMSPLTLVRQPWRWLETISRWRGTHSGGPNFAYSLCVRKIPIEKREGLDLTSWRVAYNGAEPIYRKTLEQFYQAFRPFGFRWSAFFPGYGLAEATLAVSTKQTEAPAFCTVRRDVLESEHRVVAAEDGAEDVKTLVGCGQAIGDTRLAIVDPETRLRCDPDQVGEIWIANPCVALGYWNLPDATLETFGAHLDDTGEGPFLRTGDLGFLREGELYVTGRLKDLIIIRGGNFYPQDIELTVEQSHPALRPGCGAAFSLEVDGEERLVVVQEAKEDPKLDVQELARQVCRAVAEIQGLQVWALALIGPSTIPKTSSGKIQRHACREDLLAGRLATLGGWFRGRTVGAGSIGELLNRQIDRASGPPAPAGSTPTSAVPGPIRAAAIRDWLCNWLITEIGLDAETLDTRVPFTAYGLDSVMGTRLAGDLQSWLGRPVEVTLVWDCPTIAAVADHLGGEEPGAHRSRSRRKERREEPPVAIIGIGCRFPGASTPEAFWDLLASGGDAIIEVPAERWDIDAYYDPDPSAPGRMSTRRGGFVEELDRFDAAFFGLSPREVSQMDPQHRLLMEAAWEAFEDAGLVPQRLAGTSTGVFVGIAVEDFRRMMVAQSDQLDGYSALGTSHSIAANRLSYLFDFHGPSMSLDTACSSSLVAVHLACQSLRSGESILALAGGANVMLTPEPLIELTKARLLAPDGRCKSFDARADGYARSEGAGLVILKLLPQALADGDSIYAVIRGGAVNQDGRTNGLTSPNRLAQEELLHSACRAAGVAPSRVLYVEAHGTGTEVGDAIECRALGAVFGRDRRPEHPCLIGSAKSNIGHLETAAGIVGLIKVALSLRHGEIPASLHFAGPNPQIPFEELGLQVQDSRGPWPTREEGAPRLAGVSSFGFGGTNSHLVLEEAPMPAAAPEAGTVERPLHVLTLSGRSEEALSALAVRYLRRPEAGDAELADLCYSANTGRTHFEHRLAVVAATSGELRRKLLGFAEGHPESDLYRGTCRSTERPKIAFLFSGQGAQYAGMARRLFDTQPRFRSVLERCQEALRSHLERPLLSVLFPAAGDEELLHQTAYTQPALFALEYALADLWQSWGVSPDALLGHSVGEFTAACVAGVLSPEEGLELIAHRARLMQELPRDGAMAAVFADEEHVAAAIAGTPADLSVAAVNGPRNVVISGRRETLEALCGRFNEEGIESETLEVSHAFHSPLMEPALEPFERRAAAVTFRAPQRLLVSNVTGAPLADGEIDAGYWRRHARCPVRFAAGMETLIREGCEVFIEIGPHTTLLGMGAKLRPEGTELWLPSLRKGEDDWQRLFKSLATLYTRGIEVDWHGFDRGYQRRRVALPRYPFQRRRYWYDRTRGTAGAPGLGVEASTSRVLGRRVRSPALAASVFESSWHSSTRDLLAHPQVDGAAVVSNSCYVSMALGAAAETQGPGPFVLHDVTFLEALALPEGQARTVQLVLAPEEEPGAGRFRFQVFSLAAEAGDGDSTWTLHVAGGLEVQQRESPAADGEPETVDEILARCPRELEEAGFHDEFPILRDFGPGFQWLDRVWLGEGEALARLRPAAADDAGGAGELPLPPAFVEAAFQLLGSVLPESFRSAAYLSSALRTFELRRPAAGTPRHCHVRLRPEDDETTAAFVGDFQLLDEEGALVARATGLRLERDEGRLSERSAGWLYEVEWQPRPLAAPEVSPAAADEEARPGWWLILTDSDGVGAALARLLEQRGESCLLIAEGESFETGPEGCQRMDPRRGDEFRRRLQEALAGASPWRGAVHLWSLSTKVAKGTAGPADLVDAQEKLCGSVLYLLQALPDVDHGSWRRLCLVTRGGQSIAPADEIDVVQAPLWGLGGVIGSEHPELGCLRLDLDPAAASDDAERLLAELLSAGRDNQVAWRDGERYAASLIRTAAAREIAAADGDVRVRGDGTYLLTGGLGALGLRSAQWLVEKGARHLMLVGRRPPADTALSALEQLREAGAQVETAAADVSDERSVAELLAQIGRRMPPLVGVLHAAGVLDDGMLLEQSWPRFATVLAPKLAGAWNLHRLTRSQPLDLFLMFSSASSLLGSPGQGNYAAANAFLDALAHLRHHQGLAALSVNWGPWEGLGMAAAGSDRDRARWARQGVETIPPRQGFELLGGLLGVRKPQVGVVPMDWRRVLQRFPDGGEPSLLSQELEALRRAPGTARAVQAAGPELIHRLEKAGNSDPRMLVTAYVEELTGRVLGISPSETMDPRMPFREMGLDSLTAMQLRQELMKATGLELPATLLFNYRSLETLSEVVSAALLDGAEIPDSEDSIKSNAKSAHDMP